MAKVNVGGFKPADDNHLLPVREMEATDLWLQAKRTGDATKIAAAKANLDAITAQRVALEGRTPRPRRRPVIVRSAGSQPASRGERAGWEPALRGKV